MFCFFNSSSSTIDHSYIHIYKYGDVSQNFQVTLTSEDLLLHIGVAWLVLKAQLLTFMAEERPFY